MAILDSYKHHQAEAEAEAEAGELSTVEELQDTPVSATPPSPRKEQIAPSSNSPGKLEDMVATLKVFH